MQFWDARDAEKIEEMKARRKAERKEAGNVKCPYCGSTNAREIPEIRPTSFRHWHCDNCSQGFTVCVTVECPECGSGDISLCYAGKGNFELWYCGGCKKGFAKGELVS